MSKRYPDSPLGPATAAVAVTPHNTNQVLLNGRFCRAVYVGGAGNLSVTMADGGDVTFSNVGEGQLLDICVSHIRATGTTATSIVTLF